MVQSGTPGCVRHLIHVLDGPTITSQPQSIAINAGSNAAFSVAATGTGPLTYQWLFNCINIAGATNFSYSVTNAQFSDWGSYSVIVTDTTGSTTSSNAVLTINTGPFITAQPTDQVVPVGQTATFTVGAVGHPAAWLPVAVQRESPARGNQRVVCPSPPPGAPMWVLTRS